MTCNIFRAPIRLCAGDIDQLDGEEVEQSGTLVMKELPLPHPGDLTLHVHFNSKDFVSLSAAFIDMLEECSLQGFAPKIMR